MPFPEEKEAVHKEKAQVGFRLKAFNNFTFGVIKDATVKRVGKATVTLDFGERTETYPKDKETWFFYPHEHPLNGQSFTFE